MSIQLVDAVTRLPFTRGEKAVMVALALHADDSGHCWPNQDTIALAASMTTRRVRPHLHNLAARGWIEVLKVGNGRGRSSEYLLNVDRLKADVACIKADVPAPLSATERRTFRPEKADVVALKADVLAEKADVVSQPIVKESSGIVSESLGTAKTRRKAVVPLTADERAKLLAEFAHVPEANDLIDLAISHEAHKKYPENQYGYVRNWLRNDWKRNGGTNGRTNPPQRNSGTNRSAPGPELDAAWERYKVSR